MDGQTQRRTERQTYRCYSKFFKPALKLPGSSVTFTVFVILRIKDEMDVIYTMRIKYEKPT